MNLKDFNDVKFDILTDVRKLVFFSFPKILECLE